MIARLLVVFSRLHKGDGLLQPITAALVIASDIHLITADDSRGQLLTETLARIDPRRVRYLVLLGDIFDFCFGASPYFRRKYAEIGEALSALAAAGVKVIFFQGNHEFALDDLGWHGVEFVTDRDKILTFDDGLTVALSHGDRLAAPWHYHIYCAITRSWLFKRVARLVPARWLDSLALDLSRRSRSRDGFRPFDHRFVLASLEAWLTSTGCHHGIVGHFHVPYDIRRSTPEGGRLLCLKSWDEPNLLTFDGLDFARCELFLGAKPPL